jgi:excisionase family DNA binding protein
MTPQKIQSVTVGQAAKLLSLQKAMLYAAIKEGTLKAWRPWAKGDLRINLDELHRWAGGPRTTNDAAA